MAGRRQGLWRRLVLASILERGVLKDAGRGEMVAVTRISRRLRSYMIVHGVLRYFEINSSKRS